MIKDFTAEWVPWILVLLLTATLFIAWFTVDKQCSKCQVCENVMLSIDRYSMYNKSLRDATVNGVYFSDGYYCVWTADRQLSDINKTECHEVCHALIAGDFDGYTKEHFCD